MTTGAEIMRVLGGRRNGRTYMCRCPCHADRGPSLAVRDSEVGPLVHCHAGCPQGIVVDELKRLGLWPSRDPSAPVPRPIARPARDTGDDQARTEYARAIWAAGVDPKGTLGERYLNTRKRPLALADDLRMRTLRFHPRCPFGRDAAGNRRNVPALLAAFRPLRNDVLDDDKPNAIHRIGLNADGSKIDKLMSGPVGGCAVKVDADELVTDGLSICEGIETAIAIRQRFDKRPPIWALGSAGAIAKLEPIPGIEALTIFADHDATGLKAANDCAQRWANAGLEARVVALKSMGLDFADA
jgi:hypothetical protein